MNPPVDGEFRRKGQGPMGSHLCPHGKRQWWHVCTQERDYGMMYMRPPCCGGPNEAVGPKTDALLRKLAADEEVT